jgi:hypothetical protein
MRLQGVILSEMTFPREKKFELFILEILAARLTG